ncbi:MAG: hypothetical protein K2L16_09255 [Muribaculaceae bacterium]|nr:hypothetical protein [Muribaculaceae bacterium]
MQEFDEQQAVAAMCRAIGAEPGTSVEDDVCEVLDLIYDYYESHGELSLDLGDDDADDDIADMVAYIARHLRKNGPEQPFSDSQLTDMVKAEIDYEDSII